MDLLFDDLMNLDDNALNDLVDKIISSSVGDNSDDVWVVDINGVRDMRDAFNELKTCFSGDGVRIDMTVFDRELELGFISITGYDTEIVCIETGRFVSVCRKSRGVDILSHTDGQTEIMLGFNTAKKVVAK